MMRINLPGNSLDGAIGRIVATLNYPTWPAGLVWLDIGGVVLCVSSLFCVEVQP